jgi:hypothetical protein
VEHGWSIVLEVLDSAQQQRDQGFLRGHIAFRKEEKKWRDNSALESVETAQKALNAKKEGRDVDDVFKEHRKEVEDSLKPREPAMELSKQEMGAVDGAKIGLTPDMRARTDGAHDEGQGIRHEHEREKKTVGVADFGVANGRPTSA